MLTLNKRPTCNFYMSVFYLLRVHDKMHLTTSISPLRRRVPFVMIQKEPKDHLGEGGFRFPPSPKYPFPLKRPIRGAAAPLLDVSPPGGRTPRRFSYWLIGSVPLFRRGAQRAPAGYRAAVIRRGGYQPPVLPVSRPSVGVGPRPARWGKSGNDGMGIFRLRARTQGRSSDTLAYVAGAETS